MFIFFGDEFIGMSKSIPLQGYQKAPDHGIDGFYEIQLYNKDRNMATHYLGVGLKFLPKAADQKLFRSSSRFGLTKREL
jgi:hypothetical protein